MLDENLPTYRFRPSSENPLHTLLYFTHRGSDPEASYLVKRPAPAESRNQYALGLLDVHYASVIYGEVLLLPQWSQPTLSAAEVRAQGPGAGPPVPLTPDTFSVSLYNPDQAVAVKLVQGSWGKSDYWEFEIPEQTFRQPSTSRIDQDSGAASHVPELVPKVVFRWKRDGRLSKDMICFMSGRSVGGKKNKEPDITVAMFRGSKNDGALAIYEPNMARVDVEDRKGLEVVLLLSAEVIRNLYLMPQQDPFNAAGGGAASARASNRRKSSAAAGPGVPTMSGAIGDAAPSSPSTADPRNQAGGDADAEAKRIQEMVSQEERVEREQRDAEEQQRIKKMLEDEETEERMREAQVNMETERLRKEYGYDSSGPNGQNGPAPPLPNRPRPAQGQNPGQFQGQFPPPPTTAQGPYPQQSHGGWFGPPTAQYTLPVRPMSAEPPGQGGWGQPFGAPAPPQATAAGNGGGKKQHGTLANMFNRSEEDKRKKMKKKRSVHF